MAQTKLTSQVKKPNYNIVVRYFTKGCAFKTALLKQFTLKKATVIAL